MSFLPWPKIRDRVAAQRALTLLPGIGPKKAEQLHQMLLEPGNGFAAWSDAKPPAKAAEEWPQFVSLLQHLADAKSPAISACR